MAELNWFKNFSLIAILFLPTSFQPSFSAQNSTEEKTLMGKESEVILQKRTVDPIRAGKRAIRVLVNYNATNYFIIEGKQAGLEYEMMRSFETYLNKGLTAEKKHHLIFIALPFDQLIPALVAGKGDIIAAGMTITAERRKKVNFSNPYRTNISEVLVRNKNAEKLLTAAQLAGKTVYVVKGSSYFTHLKHLSDELQKEGKPAINIIETDENLASEDLLQMVNAGVYQYTIVDSHIANLWSRILKNIVPETGVAISTGGQIAWAVRKSNKDLLYKLNLFLRNYKQGTKYGNILFNRYYKNTKWIENPVKKGPLKRLHEYQKSFIKYGKKYNIDWVMLAALGYQESKLNQNKKSNRGAVGVMQIKPSTAADKNIRITGVSDSYDKNIHAATKYLAFLRSRYFSDPKIEPIEQLAFTLAAYNAGPAKISKMRNKAKKLGKNPNKWFFNVENVTRRYASSEPVEYVANIMKYYLAFKSVIEAAGAKRKAEEKVK
ncbi:membrane-bound lytic murein transglycosylase F precursor [bacterium BMS3Bbin11]|nr:membrane-bound lytic murein transglycosylase F precursor [bacterium BMS3Abin11]GBE45262.1 membrane-bound lytic murein transglycosylase F precursor [bacterium BMS3Bbin11]